ncbi:GGDEF domain-containing protein [Vibrio parahaemolyticus]|nr:GGDEF domain-containing protein [Vibrio parahaemolyticus]
MQFTLEHAQEVLSGMPDPTFILSEDGVYLDVFGGSDKKTYHDGQSLIGKALHRVLEKAQADWFVEQIRHSLAEQDIVTIQYKLDIKDIQGIDHLNGPQGEVYYEAKVCPLELEYQGRRAVLIQSRNVSHCHQREALLRYQSQIDSLTNIFNRRVFFEKLSEEVVKSQSPEYQGALLLFDLDFFKVINDKRGHDAGDYVLESLADLVSNLLMKDETFARVGGEEFAIILSGSSLSEARELGEEVRSHIQNCVFEFKQIEIPVTVSVGVVNIIQNETTKGLYARVDKVLYAAKRNGRNCVVSEEKEQE